MLDRGNGIVLKAIQTPPRGTRELTLYQTIFAPSCKDKHLLELRNFLPMYYGTETVDDGKGLIRCTSDLIDLYQISQLILLDTHKNSVSSIHQLGLMADYQL